MDTGIQNDVAGEKCNINDCYCSKVIANFGSLTPLEPRTFRTGLANFVPTAVREDRFGV